ncbi:MAG: hypothetical protein QG574_2990 [Cyanobacteriota bacterium erpe_2018_sw_21hr_WHONDRS-SW48-000092_B_bin.40]|jgi:hypothetical protein|nr:hypothetical protein [Cyanobacteriota bacterium erpe_2018_sw_21hr_WHONDRS-SW48-000092_B_bin.40]
MIPLYTWRGSYCGFIQNNCIFDLRCRYLGWLENDGRAWHSDGHFWGELVDENYILRRTSMATPARRAIRATPATPATPAVPATRATRAIRAGYTDAFTDI